MQRFLKEKNEMETTSFSPFDNTTVKSTSAHTSGSITAQADCSSGYEPWVVGVAAGIPSILTLVLAVILVVVCVTQWKNYSSNQMNQHPNGQEEHEYELSPPRPPNDFYMTMVRGTTNIYVNEDQDRHCKQEIQTQSKPTRMQKCRRETPVVESVYENHPPCHWKKPHQIVAGARNNRHNPSPGHQGSHSGSENFLFVHP